MQAQYIVFPKPNVVEVCTEEVSTQDLAPLEVVVRNEASIISAGTELSRLTDVLGGTKYPLRPGYGSIGRVVAKGSGVEDVQIGQRVFYAGKHASVQRFLHGQNHQWGILYPVREDVDPVEATFACLAQIAMTAPNVTQLHLGDTVAVFGLGAVGNLAAQLYRLAGARVIGLDPVEARCEQARRVGIAEVINVAPDQQVQAVKDLTAGQGAHVTVDAAGHSAVIANALQATRLFGQVILLGTPRAAYSRDITPLMMKIHESGLVVRGAHMWRIVPSDIREVRLSVAWALRTVIDFIAAGQLKVRELLTHTIGPDEVPAAYEGLQSNPQAYTGVVIDWR